MPTHRFATFSKSLEAGKLAPAYYFLGAENVLKEQGTAALLARALDPALRDFNLDIRSAQQLEPEDVLPLCTTLPMMADRRVVVVRDVEAWKRKTRGKKAVLDYLKRPIPETLLVLVQGAAAEAKDDKADADLAELAYTVECAELSLEEAGAWLEREAAAMEVSFARGAAAHLLRAVGADLGALRSELQKFQGLAAGGPISLEQVGDLVGVRHGQTPFDWRNAVMGGDTAAALRLVPAVLSQSGVSAVRLVQMLGTALVATSALRGHYDRKVRGRQLASEAWALLKATRPGGIGPWGEEVTHLCRWAETWTQRRLRAAIRAALDADRSSKGTTVSDEAGIVRELVLRVGKKD